MIVLCCGSRLWTNDDIIRRELTRLPFTTGFYNDLGVFECLTSTMPIEIVEGEATGADTRCSVIAEQLGYVVHRCPALWKSFGRSAGPIRNQAMLDLFNVNLTLAFHEDIDSSIGTKDMVRRSRRAGIPTLVVTHYQTEIARLQVTPH